MSQIARTYLTLYDFGSQESPFTEYYDEVEMNEKWFDSYSTTIREFIRPGSTVIPETSTTASSNTTQNPPAQDSSASSNLDSCMILLQLLVLSVSVKLLVCINQSIYTRIVYHKKLMHISKPNLYTKFKYFEKLYCFLVKEKLYKL